MNSESDSNTEGEAVGKKRLRSTDKWKRIKIRNAKAKGKQHVNYANKVISARHTGVQCQCRLKCMAGISQVDQVNIQKHFNGLGDKSSQDSYLCAHIKVSNVQRRRPRTGEDGLSRAFTYIYKTKVMTNEYLLCKNGFRLIYGITRARIERLARYIAHNVGAPKDQRGKHDTRPNRVTEHDIANVDSHIRSFPRRLSHYSRKDNIKKHYLSPELNISVMHKLYLEKYEIEMYIELTAGRKIKPRVSYDFYNRYFNTKFNLSFGKPRTDTCEYCDELQKKIACEANENASRLLTQQKELHLRKADIFYDRLKSETERSKNDPTVACLTFDFQQNLPIPVVPSGDVFYARQMWVYNLGIHSCGTGKAHMYMFDEVNGTKGPNEVISCLKHYFDNIMSQDVTELVLFSDNCAAQNKNKFMVQFLFMCTFTGKFKKITHYFPERGHSFLPCDRDFANIEKKKRCIQRLYLPEEWEGVVKKSSKQFTVVHMNQEMFVESKAHFKNIYKPTWKNNAKQNFTISKYKIFRYNETHRNTIKVAESQSGTVFSEFSLLKPNFVVDANALPYKALYERKLPLKQAKFTDVMKLANKYVSQDAMWFYEELTSDAAVEADEMSGGSEYESD